MTIQPRVQSVDVRVNLSVIRMAVLSRIMSIFPVFYGGFLCSVAGRGVCFCKHRDLHCDSRMTNKKASHDLLWLALLCGGLRWPLWMMALCGGI